MFPNFLDGASVLFFSHKDDYGIMCNTDGNVVAHFKYLAICKYDDGEGYYLFKCNEEYEVVSDSLWDSIEMCMRVTSESYSKKIIWVEKK